MAPQPRILDERLHALTYERTDVHHICLDFDRLARCCPLDYSSESPDSEAKRSSLGTIDVLPLELRTVILLHLDFPSLSILRSVSKGSRLAIDELPHYRLLRAEAPDILRAVTGLQINPSGSVLDAYQALTSCKCLLCGDYGPFLYLLSFARACFLCLSESEAFLPLSPVEANTTYALDTTISLRLPRLRSLPGRYSHKETLHRRRKILIDRTAAEEAGISLHGSLAGMKKVSEARREAADRGWQERMQKYLLDSKISPTLRKPAEKHLYLGFDGQAANPHRFMGVIRVPWLDCRSDTIEKGLHVKGAQEVKCTVGLGIDDILIGGGSTATLISWSTSRTVSTPNDS